MSDNDLRNRLPPGPDADPDEPPPGPGIGREEMARALEEFDREQDEYLAAWERMLRQGLAGGDEGGEEGE